MRYEVEQKLVFIYIDLKLSEGGDYSTEMA